MLSLLPLFSVPSPPTPPPPSNPKSPANLYVRSVDSEAIVRGVTGMIRGLMTNAIDAGAVRIETGLNREEDVLLPRLSACPVSCIAPG